MDDGIGDTFASVEAETEFLRCCMASTWLDNRAEAAIVTDRRSGSWTVESYSVASIVYVQQALSSAARLYGGANTAWKRE